MFFKKKKDDFELKTEENYSYNNSYDTDDVDYFKYEEETVPYVASRNSDEFIINRDKDKDKDTVIEHTNYVETPISDTYVYTDSNSDDSNTYVNVQNVNYYDNNDTIELEDSEEKFHFSPKIIYILNKIFSVLLVITIIVSIIILFDVIMLTRFRKGPFFAIRTETYDDGGTVEYKGFGYKVIKYHTLDGRRDMVVGDYSLVYDNKAKNISLVDLGNNFKNDYKTSFNEFVGAYLNVSGVVSKVDTKNNIVTLKYSDDSKVTYKLKCLDVQGKISKLKIGEEVNIKGILYIDSIDTDIDFYLEDSTISK